MLKRIGRLGCLFLLVNLLNFVMVEASSAKISLNCSSSEVVVLKSITCDVNLLVDDPSVDTVKFTIDNGPFTITFKEASGFTNSSSTNNIQLSKTNLASGKIGTLTVAASGSVSEGSKEFVLKNMVVSNSNDENTSYNNDDIRTTIKVIGNRSNNNKLKSLTIDGVSVANFSSSKKSYNVVVNNNKVLIGAVSDDAKAQVEGLGEKILNLGANAVNVVVTAEDGSKSTYTLNIEYVLPKSSDNTLKALELWNEDEKIAFNYDASKTSFDIEVLGTVEKVKIKPTLNDEKAKYIKNYGEREVKLNYGVNKVEVRVQAENEKIKTYVLNITRVDDRSNDTSLRELVVNSEIVSLSSNIFEYKVDVRYKYQVSDIKAVATDSNASVKFENINLVDGENKPIIIKVTALNGDIKEYKVVINRLSEAESKVVLQNITVNGYDLAFNVNKSTYDLTIKNSDTSLIFNIFPTEDLKYEVLNNENLQNGSTIVISVTDDEGVKSYTINIHKTTDKIMGIPVNIFCYIVFSIGVIALIISISYVVRKNKRVSNEKID